ncbi:GNAT family N-acetyltransferase [Nocardioides sp.]|uniref:GNAT family N-acetyltransferase n=1 Tax=Nocardioides sp. TaxID=35761 RepID=UPI003567079A
MLWRVRTTLPDRPGALALLAEQCGLAEVNILGLQIFPGVEAVTDELVLRTPQDWGAQQIGRLIEAAGGTDVVAAVCSEDALADQATLYVQAARAILDRPTSFPEVVGRLFEADLAGVSSEPVEDGTAQADVMEMTVGEVEVQVRRAVPFTATEHTRAAALTALVSDVLTRVAQSGPVGEPRPSGSSTPSYVGEGDSVAARVDEVVIGRAAFESIDQETGAVQIGLSVDPAWQRRGIGTRLLIDVARLAHQSGAQEIVLTTGSDNPAVLPMVLAAGLRGRIRLAGDTLTVRIGVTDLRPLRT